jgi:hypothetical protein
VGINDAPKVAIIFIGTFFQQVLVIANTVRRVEPSLVEAAQTLGASRRAQLLRVVLPASIADIYQDLRVLLGWAWTYLIVAELIGTSSGITYFINLQAKYRQYDKVMAAILLIGVVGLGSDLILGWIGRSLFPWRKDASHCFDAPSRARLRVVADEPRMTPPLPWRSIRHRSRLDRMHQREEVLEVRSLGKVYPSAQGPVEALRELSFSVHRANSCAWWAPRAAASPRWCASWRDWKTATPDRCWSTARP